MSDVFNIGDVEAFKVLEGSSCAFGVFDGVHKGHRFLIHAACSQAQSAGCKSVALTFDIDPDERFHPERLKKLHSNEDRISLLANSGVDAVVVLPFTNDFASLSPQDFLDRTFGENIPSTLHVGSDFRFGARAAGTTDFLIKWGNSHAMNVYVHDLFEYDGTPITSTRIRCALECGDVDVAASLLGYPYTLRDRVVEGRGEGRDMGFCTANLVVEPMRRVLREGVYGGYAIVGDKRYKAAVSIGVSPTFRDRTDAYSEVHILDFAGDIYDEIIRVEFVSWLRPLIDFDSVDELIQTVMGNIAWVRDNL